MVRAKRGEIGEALGRDLGLRRLDIFDSAISDAFDVESRDVDVLAEFDTRPGFDYFGSYFRISVCCESEKPSMRRRGQRAYLWEALGAAEPLRDFSAGKTFEVAMDKLPRWEGVIRDLLAARDR